MSPYIIISLSFFFLLFLLFSVLLCPLWKIRLGLPDTINQNWIGSGLVLHNIIQAVWKNATESESGKLVAGRLRHARTGPDAFGQNLTWPSGSDPGRFYTISSMHSLEKRMREVRSGIYDLAVTKTLPDRILHVYWVYVGPCTNPYTRWHTRDRINWALTQRIKCPPPGQTNWYIYINNEASPVSGPRSQRIEPEILHPVKQSGQISVRTRSAVSHRQFIIITDIQCLWCQHFPTYVRVGGVVELWLVVCAKGVYTTPFRAQELCESRGGRTGVPGRKATLTETTLCIFHQTRTWVTGLIFNVPSVNFVVLVDFWNMRT